MNDPLYVTPFVDVDEHRDEPVPHRYVHGGFADTDLRFSCYFPPAERYRGRFFQPVLPMAGTEHGVTGGMYDGMGGSFEFAFDSGAYLVESNMGSFRPQSGADATTTYRSAAAAAEFARGLAVEMYGGDRPYGYVYGGSGGAFKSIACLESMPGVWDGAAPFVAGSPMSIPNVFAVQAHAMRLLWDHLPQIVDALEPGGSGDMFAGLDTDQREALAEVTRFGFPPGAWFDAHRINATYTMLWTFFADTIRAVDPAYFDDFWTVPGYLGANPPASMAKAALHLTARVTGVVMADDPEAAELPASLARMVSTEVAALPVAVRIDTPLQTSARGASFRLIDGAAAGRTLYVSNVIGELVLISDGGDPKGLRDVAVGDEVLIDNRDYLAFQTYHRHQYAEGYAAWDQYMVNGTQMYPQRPTRIGPTVAKGGSGSLQSGRFDGKMILLESMLDEAAYPWQADWYRTQVLAALGERIDDQFRLWFADHAMHGSPSPMVTPGDVPRPSRLNRTIDYRGLLEQTLLHLVDWVERDVMPPASTAYDVVEGQVILPDTASERRGIQPVVGLTVKGGARIDVTVGESVELTGRVVVPAGGGTITAVAWDFDGSGEFVDEAVDDATTTLDVSATHVYEEPGTYFVALRATSQHDQHRGTPHGRAHNLGRVRVVVS